MHVCLTAKRPLAMVIKHMGAFLWDDPYQDQWSEITRIMVDQMNRWIHSVQRIHRFIWSTMIQVIWDRWSWYGSSQGNAPMESSISILQWSRRSTLGSICDVSFKYSRETSNWFRRTITRKLQEKNKTICSSQILYHEPNKNQERCLERWMLYEAFKRRKTGRYWNASYFERLNFISTCQSLMTTSY